MLVAMAWKTKKDVQGLACSCFYKQNIYLKSFDIHVTYPGNEDDFRNAYAMVSIFSNVTF